MFDHPHSNLQLPNHFAAVGIEARRRQREDDPDSFSWDRSDFPRQVVDDDAVSEDSNEDTGVPLEEHTLEIDEGEREAASTIPAELRDNTVTGQEYDAYMASSTNTRKRFSGKIDLNKRIDEIDKRLVAKFRVEDLFRRFRGKFLAPTEESGARYDDLAR